MENKDFFQKAQSEGLEIRRTLERFVDNEALLIKFLKKFFDETHPEELKELLAAGKFQDASNVAHTLKGVTANLGIEPLNKLFTKILRDLRAVNYEGLQSMAEEIEKEFYRLKEKIF